MSQDSARLRRLIKLIDQQHSVSETEVLRARAEHAQLIAERDTIGGLLQTRVAPMLLEASLRRFSALDRRAREVARVADALCAKLRRIELRREHFVERQRCNDAASLRGASIRDLTAWLDTASAIHSEDDTREPHIEI